MDLSNPAACLDLLQKLHPTDIPRTHAMLADMIEALLHAAPAPNQHLEVLEAAREVIACSQDGIARRYTSLPLPPDSEENASLQQVVRLWRNLSRSYAQIARLDATAGTLDDQRALLAQRRTHYAGLALFEYFRARREVPAGGWTEIHSSHADAVRMGVHRVRVSDPLNEIWHAQSALEAYVSILLTDLANPYGRSERELNWVIRWAQRFAPYCSLSEADEDARPADYGVDLHGDVGLRPLGLMPRTPARLRFDGSTLATQIQAVLAQFKRGAKPASLGLGEDCPTDASARLLLSLYRPWGRGTAGRRFPRRRTEGRLALTADWLTIGFAIEGVVFRQPRGENPLHRLREDISLLTLGARAPEVDTPQHTHARHQRDAERLGLDYEQWEVLDQSVAGFRIQRHVQGERVAHHQLVGIHPPDGDRFLLGDLSWLMYREDGTLEAGVEVLPGMPGMVSVRQAGPKDGRAPYQQGFLLPESNALKIPASIILPSQWYAAGQLVDVHQQDTTRQIRLRRLVRRGTNYDLCAFEAVEPCAAGNTPG
ncbi:hypothetical protein [Thauera linaloolentis]|uniref:Molecular chaperone n=1 Tax=Thauera linaloolentis (strain DSM 12138 / JCM 21573 / CCUG 41526 / CIP 105981 / IAM 15112 / NBRC 102519 / 47Lol) TaxID=1123367 RepID=N6Z201_THAL4|nr:hypothetical protein [Thauera linaloolentis]ENO86194.1 hypothetical protein C666_13825 [Thauera linaloolentis 47Lol = DSM 12138]MCM8567242.1 hypothetical protein [Thauera linaloolentis]